MHARDLFETTAEQDARPNAPELGACEQLRIRLATAHESAIKARQDAFIRLGYFRMPSAARGGENYQAEELAKAEAQADRARREVDRLTVELAALESLPGPHHTTLDELYRRPWLKDPTITPTPREVLEHWHIMAAELDRVPNGSTGLWVRLALADFARSVEVQR